MAPTHSYYFSWGDKRLFPIKCTLTGRRREADRFSLYPTLVEIQHVDNSFQWVEERNVFPLDPLEQLAELDTPP